MKERGSALLTAVIIVMVLLSISGIFFTMVIYQSKNESSEEKGLRAYYLAEAGVQYGIAAGIEAILDGTLEEGGTLSPSRVNDPFGQGGWFKVTVAREVGATSFTVKSTGDYYDARRIIKAEYEFGEEDDGNGNGGGGDNCDDDLVLPNYPPWIHQDYQAHSYVSYDGRGFYSRYYASANQVPGIPGNYWQEITKKWTNFNSYNQNDIVCYNGKKYKARYNMTDQFGKVPGEGGSNNFWQELTNQWKHYNSYNQGDFVFHEGKLFRARYNMTDQVGKVPGEGGSSNFWQELTDQWTYYDSYNQGDIVYYDDKLFQARYNMTDQVGKVPGEVDHGNSWQELTNEWRPFNYYNQGDTVLYNGQWYKATKNLNQVPQDPENNSKGWDRIASPTAPVLVGILVTPKNPPPAKLVGQTQTFTATAIYSNGSTADVSNTANWTSSNTSIATMAARVATARATGIVTGFNPIPISTPVSIPVPITIPITATFEGKAGTGYLTVTVPTNSNPDPDPGTNTGGILWEKEVIE